jgi:hypothetical protein
MAELCNSASPGVASIQSKNGRPRYSVAAGSPVRTVCSSMLNGA